MPIMRTILLSLACLWIAVPNAEPTAHPHYAFVLPDGYAGWLQIIFNDPHAEHLPRHGDAYLIDIPDSGNPKNFGLASR